jgi:DNA-binding transcriptional LysR family regulator
MDTLHTLKVDKAQRDVQYLFMPDQDVVSLGDVELRHFRYFIAVAEELHFGRAAEKLHMAQPPLSQQIRRLEEWVGHPLFARNSRSVRLTPAGEELRKRLKMTIAKIENDVRSARQVGRGERGALDVGFVESSILTTLPALLGRYRLEFPGVRLRLQELHTTFLVDALHDGRVDVGFLRDAGRVSGLSTESVHSEPFVAIVPAKHPLARRRSIEVDALRHEPFVLFAQANGLNAWHKTIGICEERGFQPEIVQEAPQWLTILRLVGAGIGVTIAPRCVSQIATPDVVCMQLKGVQARSQIELAVRLVNDCAIIEGFLALARTAFGSRVAIPNSPLANRAAV